MGGRDRISRPFCRIWSGNDRVLKVEQGVIHLNSLDFLCEQV